MIDYIKPETPQILSSSGNISDANFTGAGSRPLFTGGILIAICFRIVNYTAQYQTRNPLFQLSYNSSTGAVQDLQFISNAANPYFIIYPAPLLNANNSNPDINTSAILSLLWGGNILFTPVGSIVYYQAYYLTLPLLP